MNAHVHPFFDPDTFTYSYVVSDPATQQCVVIDPVLDIDMASGRLSTGNADRIIEYIRKQKLTLTLILETHVHADHLSAGHYLKQQLGGETGIGEHVDKVQQTFGPMFNAGCQFATNGSQFDHLYADGDAFMVGELKMHAIHTPGHTPACVTYVIDGAAFVGDTLFMPDYGTARTDFPGGNAGELYDSIQKILALPEDTVLYMCHDYLPDGRNEYQHQTTVRAEQAGNVHLSGKSRQQFIEQRQARDKKLAAPRLLLPSIQVNMRAGELPPPEANEMRYLKIPLRADIS